ncbi:MAG TPA: ribonuclease III [Candidatus Omnitrophota bacterium]|nr:ribonuclease III [Candidatus Omnitrophota bacterium]
MRKKQVSSPGLSAPQKKKIKDFERKTRLVFGKKTVLLGALTHPSYRNEYPQKGLPDFERFEFFGDAVLNFAVSERLFRVFPASNEGELSQIRSVLVSRKTLAKAAKKIPLRKFLFLSGDRQNLRQGMEKILADSFEALIAAVFFDLGIGRAKALILKYLEPYMRLRLLKRTETNPKGLLQEWVQKKYKILPEYRMAFKKNGVTAVVRAGRAGKAAGKGSSKKEAQEKAASALLKLLKSKEKTKGA